MYRVALVLLALFVAAGADSVACGRLKLFRNRSCCATYCQPTAPTAPTEPTEPDSPAPDATPLTAAEEAQLKALLDAHKKADTYDAKGLKEFENYFRSATPAQRAEEKAPEAPGATPLTKEEEKMLKAILESYKKDKQDEKFLKEYEKFFRETTPEERSKDFKELKKEGTQADAPAKFLVHLPADAKLTIDGNPTTSISSLRLFETPALRVNAVNLYELKATIERGGIRTSVTRVIRVVPGETTEVTLQIPVNQNLQVARR
jgi:uncharacterized protein (TIGR03000 family)